MLAFGLCCGKLIRFSEVALAFFLLLPCLWQSSTAFVSLVPLKSFTQILFPTVDINVLVKRRKHIEAAIEQHLAQFHLWLSAFDKATQYHLCYVYRWSVRSIKHFKFRVALCMRFLVVWKFLNYLGFQSYVYHCVCV